MTREQELEAALQEARDLISEEVAQLIQHVRSKGRRGQRVAFQRIGDWVPRVRRWDRLLAPLERLAPGTPDPRD